MKGEAKLFEVEAGGNSYDVKARTAKQARAWAQEKVTAREVGSVEAASLAIVASDIQDATGE